MTTLTFKVTEDEAKVIRSLARSAKLSLSEFLRRKVRSPEEPKVEVKLVRSRLTGVQAFAGTPDMPPLTTESVREMMETFP